MTKHSESAYTVHQALNDDLCDELIALAEAQGFDEAPITTASGPVMNKRMRNNTRVIYDSQELADRLWPLIAEHAVPHFHQRDVLGINERFRIYRYDVGQQFDWHYDGYFQRENGERSLYTLMFYLNDDFEGGCTEFNNFSVKPQRGDALFFWHLQNHRGAPVTAGRKYAIRSDVMYTPVIE